MGKILKLSAIIIILVSLFTAFTNTINAQSFYGTPFEGVIQNVIKEEKTPDGTAYISQTLEVKITTGDEKDKVVTIENGLQGVVKPSVYKAGDNVYMTKSNTTDGVHYVITDYIRRPAIYLLVGIFVIVTVLVTGKKGVRSILGLLVTFAILFGFILPQILAGQNAILIAIVGAMAIIFVSFYLTHGFNKKTSIAIAGTLISLVITGIISLIFIDGARLSGFASDEARFLFATTQGNISIQGLLLASIIIGMAGILDDITISQTSIAIELKHTDSNLKFKQLYNKTMNIGKDHIASIVNTLIVVYASAALPLLLLFIISQSQFTYLINLEIVAEEIVRTLLASIGLIGAVPITTLLACYVLTKTQIPVESDSEAHLGHNH